MKRLFFIASAASAISFSPPLLAKAEDLAPRAGIETNVKASGWGTPRWYCGSAVVRLDIGRGVYYRNGDRWYGRTKRDAYTCEKEAIDARHRAIRLVSNNTL